VSGIYDGFIEGTFYLMVGAGIEGVCNASSIYTAKLRKRIRP